VGQTHQSLAPKGPANGGVRRAKSGLGVPDAQNGHGRRADKVSTVLPSAPNWAPAWRDRSRAVSAFAACLLVVGLAPGLSRAQDGDTAARVQKLEAEIANLKVMVGTLESLVRTTPPSALAQDSAGQSAASQDDLGPRVAALETQIGALTNQIEQIGRQMSALQAKLEAAPQAVSPPPQAEAPPPQAVTPPPPAETPAPLAEMPAPQAEMPAPQAETSPPPPPVIPPDAGSADPSKPRWYGPRQDDAADGSPQGIVPPGAATGAVPDELLQSLAALPDSDAQALYEQGYGDYLQRDYAAAEAAFSSLVKDYPDDPLAGGAQYWVGETYYVRKQYKKAADTFLAGYRKYASSDKAPDTLLRLGMSLAALGQKDAACSTFKELGDKFPDAPDHLRNQAKGEAGKAGCE